MILDPKKNCTRYRLRWRYRILHSAIHPPSSVLTPVCMQAVDVNGFLTQWPQLLCGAASAARARIRREGNAQAVRAAGGVFDVLVAGCDKVSELCASGQLFNDRRLNTKDATLGVSSLIDIATLRSDSNDAFCSAVCCHYVNPRMPRQRNAALWGRAAG